MQEPADDRPSVCFVGLQNLPVLAPEYRRPGVGGAERQQVMLAKALAREGFEVSMIVHDYGQADGQVWDGVTTYRAYRPKEGVPAFRFFHPRWTGVWSAMKRADADIYYTSCADMLIGEITLFTSRYARKAVYRLAHDIDCDPGATLIRYWRDRQLYRYGLLRADLVLAQTARQQTLLRRNLDLNSRVVPSLADSGGRRRERATRDIDVLWVHNIRKLKRPELLLELARRLPQVRFDMVGGPVNGSDGLYEATRRAAQKLPNVRFHGFVPYHEVGDLYERARLFVSTSEAEGFPNTYLQAWACGTPVVAFFDPDSLIAQRSLGVAVRTLDEMQAATRMLLEHEPEWSAASSRCSAYMDQHRDERSTLAQYIDAFLSLMPQPPLSGIATGGAARTPCSTSLRD